MPLESLLELVETLRARIDEHGVSLRQNEMRTRYALIDPLLRELGWDTSNPAEVVIEDGSGDGRADYLLNTNGHPVMIIEAKRLGLGVNDGRQQAIRYAMDHGRRARYFAVTDGNQWEIYDTHQPAISMMLISFDLKETSPAEVCLKALALWRPSVVDDKVSAGYSPIVGLASNLTENTSSEGVAETRPSAGISRSSAVNLAPAGEPDRPSLHRGTEWIALSDLSPEAYSKPAGIVCPDNSQFNIQAWRAVPIETTRWLTNNGLLGPEHCPIRYSERAKRFILAVTPYHPDGKDFTAPEHVNMLYLDTHYSGRNLVRVAMTIIQRTGQDPSQFKVRLT